MWAKWPTLRVSLKCCDKGLGVHECAGYGDNARVDAIRRHTGRVHVCVVDEPAFADLIRLDATIQYPRLLPLGTQVFPPKVV